MLPRSCLVLFSCLLAAPTHAGEVNLPRLWSELSASDDGKSARALLQLAAQPDATIAFLKEQLRPVKDEPERVAQLIGDLASEKFAVRERASQELEYYGKFIKHHLEKAVAEKPSTESANRLKQLLKKIPDPTAKPKAPPALPGAGTPLRISSVNGKISINGVPLTDLVAPPPEAGPQGPPASWTRAARAVALLEHIGTSAARDLIERMAGGEADALPTTAARAALERLKMRKES